VTAAAHVDTPARTPRPGRRGGDRLVLWLTLPPLLFLLVLFAYPVARLMLLSVEGGTFEYYERALFDGLYIRVFAETFRIAALVTIFSILLGYPVAHFLANARQPWLTLGLICVLLPFWTSLLVRTYSWMVILGRNGVINNTLIEVGLITEPLALLHNETGVLIGMVHVLMPYLVFPLYAVMCRVDRDLLSAAEGLGAPGWQIFLRVYFPLTLPGLLAGAALVFIISIGFFITPALLGGGRVMMIAVLIEQHVRETLNWGFAAALCAVLLVSTLAVGAAVKRATREKSA
jgi:putative spermidine/putrescine transport system permease protein